MEKIPRERPNPLPRQGVGQTVICHTLQEPDAVVSSYCELMVFIVKLWFSFNGTFERKQFQPMPSTPSKGDAKLLLPLQGKLLGGFPVPTSRQTSKLWFFMNRRWGLLGPALSFR